MKKEISRDFVRELSLAGDVSITTEAVQQVVEVQTTTTTTTELAEVGNGAVIISEIEVSCC
jgi:RNA-binding protein YlmH